jgi:hypothetical protein
MIIMLSSCPIEELEGLIITCSEASDFEKFHWFNPLPFCDLLDHGSDRFIIEVSGEFDYTQRFDYSVNLYSYYPRKTPPISQRNRVRYIKGNFNLYVSKSTISSHIGETNT